MVLAVLASAVPFKLMITTVSIGMDHLPIVSWRFIGVDARFGLDFLVAGGLPLLALAAAGASSQWWPAGMAGATLLGALATVNLVVFLGESLRPSTPADISAGSQPDFATGFDGSNVPPLLAAVACAVGAAALSRLPAPAGEPSPMRNG
ncbi:hypothetical protein [Microbispora bryophytorum]|uniref:Uncharacterized protein n=1 Tax=Microbispora bryophytorum TaxID=1460882 RepID=A0A8H9GYP8_9ACTN|nr:hypothetical protein [Microbispora bryophytorum]MBD3139625.1 hypothetical protein [Microbispora bryophytorum]TQS02910.1 hypothetical protein FLX07_26670 [Microbispora bryophytorum]GGO03003.1 hypothetical protein GCM10011574_12380 [Microbispora bryophytorum]